MIQKFYAWNYDDDDGKCEMNFAQLTIAFVVGQSERTTCTHIHAHTLNRTIQTAKKISHNCFECIDDTYTLVNRIVDAIIIPPFGLVIIQSMPLSLSFHRSFSFSCGNFGCFFPFANSLQKWTETIVRFYSHSRKHRIWHAER